MFNKLASGEASTDLTYPKTITSKGKGSSVGEQALQMGWFHLEPGTRGAFAGGRAGDLIRVFLFAPRVFFVLCVFFLSFCSACFFVSV